MYCYHAGLDPLFLSLSVTLFSFLLVCTRCESTLIIQPGFTYSKAKHCNAAANARLPRLLPSLLFFFDNPISPSSEGGVTIVSGADNKKKRNAKIKEKRRKKQKTNKAGGGGI